MTALTDAVEAILAEASDRTRADLSGALADRGVELTGQGSSCLYSRILELHGVLRKGVPRAGEHTYTLFADRVPAPSRLNRDEALTELALRYFTSHGRPPGATSRTGPPSP